MPCEVLAAPAARWRFAALRVAATLSVGWALSLQAQQLPAPTPTPTPKPHAYVRFWNMLIGQKTDLQLMIGLDTVLTAAPVGNAFAGYVAIDPASYNFAVRPSGDANGVIKRLPIVMRQDVYITLLAAAGKDGKPDVQLIDDTINPKTDDGLGRIIVRQYFPGANVTVSVDGSSAGAPLTFGDTTTLASLPIKLTPIGLQATSPTLGAKSWNVEADFPTGGHHATLLIVPDPYGRFRPRLVFDGASRNPQPTLPAH